MEEVLKILSENPEQATAIGYSALVTGAAAYLAHRNDFGAEGRTTRELEDYLDDYEDSVSPLQIYKKHEYRKELEKRQQDQDVV